MCDEDARVLARLRAHKDIGNMVLDTIRGYKAAASDGNRAAEFLAADEWIEFMQEGLLTICADISTMEAEETDMS